MKCILSKIILEKIFICMVNRLASYTHSYVGKVLFLQKAGVTGTHRVAPEAVSKLKAKAHSMFHMYYFVLC
jgi:hypothetical protein